MKHSAHVQVAGPSASSDIDAYGIFYRVFDFFGVLDAEGRVLQLQGEIFGRTNTDPALLAGQRFSETVFWQSSENTSKQLEKALEMCCSEGKAEIILDFRISSDEKVPIELLLQPLGSNDSGQLFVCARAVPQRDR